VDDIDQQVQWSLDRDAIRNAVLQLVEAAIVDGQYDPVDDPRPMAAVLRLSALLGNVRAIDAATGIQQAITLIMARLDV
jgi:hypothetical protein